MTIGFKLPWDTPDPAARPATRRPAPKKSADRTVRVTLVLQPGGVQTVVVESTGIEE